MASSLSISPWAFRRKAEAEKRNTLLKKAIFRSPDELLALAPVEGEVRTAIRFQQEEDPENAIKVEFEGQRRGFNTGAFIAVRWEKP